MSGSVSGRYTYGVTVRRAIVLMSLHAVAVKGSLAPRAAAWQLMLP